MGGGYRNIQEKLEDYLQMKLPVHPQTEDHDGKDPLAAIQNRHIDHHHPNFPAGHDGVARASRHDQFAGR